MKNYKIIKPKETVSQNLESLLAYKGDELVVFDGNLDLGRNTKRLKFHKIARLTLQEIRYLLS